MLSEFALWLCLWVFCGLIAYGGMYAECSSDHSDCLDYDCACFRWFAFLIGPVGLFSVAIVTKFFKHGLRFK